jgi:hypothetical protein
LASVIVDRTHAVCGSGMEAASAAISPLGFVLDLMLHRILTRMRKRSAARSAGASTWLAGARGWMNAHAEARRSQDCYGGTKAIAVKAKEMRGRRKMSGVNPALGRPIYRGVHKIRPSPIQCASTALFL